MASQAGVATLGRMAGLESVMDGMEGENRTVQEEAKALHKELHGEGWESAGGESMRVMAARDVIVNPPPKPDPPPIEVIRNDQTSVEKKPMGNLTKAALALALLGSGVAGTVGTQWATSKPEPPAAEAPVPAPVNTTRRPDEIEVWRPGE